MLTSREALGYHSATMQPRLKTRGLRRIRPAVLSVALALSCGFSAHLSAQENTADFLPDPDQPAVEAVALRPAQIPEPPRAVAPSLTDVPSRPAPEHSLIDTPIEDLREIKDAFTIAPAIDRAGRPDDLWDRIRMGFGMPELGGPLVRERQQWYASRPTMLRTLFDRSKRYLYHIVGELEKRGMPTELALLPMVESAFNPMAYSPAHASGLWQFIPSTGKRYDLEQNHLYDARRDILASTNAALDYLQAIYEMHGDWHLALASYNWGENAVARAVERNRARGLPTDYASLTMPAETRYYVPKLQALKNIIANPQKFGIDIDPIPNAPYFVTVPKTRDIDIRLAARLADMPVAELVALNPAHNKPVFFSNQTQTLVLPADKAQTFLSNLENHDKPLTSWRVHTLKSGERLDKLAKDSGITLALLKQANNITARTKVTPGFQLLLPIRGMQASFEPLPRGLAPPPAVTMAREVRTVIRKVVHTVQRGDTLPSIAERYNVSVADLRRWNPIGRLMAGQKLTIEQPTTVTTTSVVRKPVRVKSRPVAKTAKRTRG
jgi:membrane-bound lytic murein transglycosylase D